MRRYLLAIPILALAALVIGLPGFLWLYGPESASNIGDIVVSGHWVKALQVPTYASAIELEARWIGETENDEFVGFREAQLYLDAVHERLEELQISLAR